MGHFRLKAEVFIAFAFVSRIKKVKWRIIDKKERKTDRGNYERRRETLDGIGCICTIKSL